MRFCTLESNTRLHVALQDARPIETAKGPGVQGSSGKVAKGHEGSLGALELGCWIPGLHREEPGAPPSSLFIKVRAYLSPALIGRIFSISRLNHDTLTTGLETRWDDLRVRYCKFVDIHAC